jgi:RimJ/RimL family protein N-acetyltransferase
MVRALLGLPELAGVKVFGAGVDPDNLASSRCLLACGFHPLDPQPDWEGIVYYVLTRTPELEPEHTSS